MGLAPRAASLALFGVVYAILVVLGLMLRENSQQLTILWPAAGLLFMALYASPRRNWPWILVVQIAVEFIIDAAHSEQFSLRSHSPFVLANSLDAIVGAFIARRLVEAEEFASRCQCAAVSCRGRARLGGQCNRGCLCIG